MTWKNEDMTRIINEARVFGIAPNRIIFHDDGKHITILGMWDPATAHIAEGLKDAPQRYVKTIDVKAEPPEPRRLTE